MAEKTGTKVRINLGDIKRYTDDETRESGAVLKRTLTRFESQVEATCKGPRNPRQCAEQMMSGEKPKRTTNIYSDFESDYTTLAGVQERIDGEGPRLTIRENVIRDYYTDEQLGDYDRSALRNTYTGFVSGISATCKGVKKCIEQMLSGNPPTGKDFKGYSTTYSKLAKVMSGKPEVGFPVESAGSSGKAPATAPAEAAPAEPVDVSVLSEEEKRQLVSFVDSFIAASPAASQPAAVSGAPAASQPAAVSGAPAASPDLPANHNLDWRVIVTGGLLVNPSGSGFRANDRQAASSGDFGGISDSQGTSSITAGLDVQPRVAYRLVKDLYIQAAARYALQVITPISNPDGSVDSSYNYIQEFSGALGMSYLINVSNWLSLEPEFLVWFGRQWSSEPISTPRSGAHDIEKHNMTLSPGFWGWFKVGDHAQLGINVGADFTLPMFDQLRDNPDGDPYTGRDAIGTTWRPRFGLGFTYHFGSSATK